MQPDFIDRDDEDDPTGNLQHIAEHGITPDEVQEILEAPDASDGTGRSTGRPIRYGSTSTGRFLIVVFEILCDVPLVVRPITAYEPDEQ